MCHTLSLYVQPLVFSGATGRCRDAPFFSFNWEVKNLKKIIFYSPDNGLSFESISQFFTQSFEMIFFCVKNSPGIYKSLYPSGERLYWSIELLKIWKVINYKQLFDTLGHTSVDTTPCFLSPCPYLASMTVGFEIGWFDCLARSKAEQ